MPKYNLNSIAMILMVLVWIFSGEFKMKLNSAKKNWRKILTISIWFLMLVISLIYSANLEFGLKNVQKGLPLLIFPLVILSTEHPKVEIKYLMKWLRASVIVFALFALIKATYFTYNGFGNYFYNQNLAALLEIHTTYYAMLCVIVILHSLHQILNEHVKLIYPILSIFFLLVLMYFLSSRMSVIALSFGVLMLLFFKFKVKSLITIVPLLAITLTVFFSPNFQEREVNRNEFGMQTPKLSSRVIHWEAVIAGVIDKGILIGSGSGTDKKHIYQAYQNYGFEEGVLHKYNAHNQFLEYFIYFGIISISAWMFCFFIWIKQFTTLNNPFLITAALVIICFMLTESILERHHGTVTFALFLSLALSGKENINELDK